jgi:hypothetical protein
MPRELLDAARQVKATAGVPIVRLIVDGLAAQIERHRRVWGQGQKVDRVAVE